MSDSSPPTRIPKPKLVIDGARCRLELEERAVEVDASDGGRITVLSLGSVNVLATRYESPLAYGTSFWPSPQSDWGWPPPLEIDKQPWAATIDGEELFLRSETNAALGLAASERISFEPSGAVRVEYGLKNLGSAPRKVAPWQNSRVRPGGLTFYPTRGGELPPSTLKPVIFNGIAWLRHDPATMTENAKSFADGAEGWLAHLESNYVFLKIWDEVPRERQAPGEAEIELYVDKTGVFVEVEEQGPYEELTPGASLHWTVHMLILTLHPHTRLEIDSPDLVGAVRDQVRKVRAESR
jgi:hypothetical protein